MKKFLGVLISIVLVILLAYGFIDYSVRSSKPESTVTVEEQLEKILSEQQAEVVLEDLEVPMAQESEEVLEATVVYPVERYIEFSGLEAKVLSTEDEATAITMNLVSKEENGVSEIFDWYADNFLYLPMLNFWWPQYSKPDQDIPQLDDRIIGMDTTFYDENYIYDWSTTTLNIYDRASYELLYNINYATERFGYMGNCVHLEDGILYIGNIYTGYAQPNSCYLIAYDIEKDEILWRSEDQTYNSYNFIVKDGVIICGYGFTNEKDYLYQIDMKTGAVLSKTEIDKMADLIIEKDGKLYVHTYSIDYVFDME